MIIIFFFYSFLLFFIIYAVFLAWSRPCVNDSEVVTMLLLQWQTGWTQTGIHPDSLFNSAALYNPWIWGRGCVIFFAVRMLVLTRLVLLGQSGSCELLVHCFSLHFYSRLSWRKELYLVHICGCNGSPLWFWADLVRRLKSSSLKQLVFFFCLGFFFTRHRWASWIVLVINDLF